MCLVIAIHKNYTRGTFALMHHLSMYCPTTPPRWGFTGGIDLGIDMKLLPHYGAFDDRSVSTQIFFVVTSFAMSNPE